ncbi:MAG: hypothetical protein KAG10_05140, partial [Methylococcales bacterium]|nr:hypothetical protein [Methylococcales bacterium]
MIGLPRTTFSQITLSLIVLLFINLLIFIFFLRWFVVDPGAMQFADMLSNQLQLLEIQCRDLQATEAQAWLQTNLPQLGYEIRQTSTHFSKLPPVRFYQIMQQSLENHYSKSLIIRLTDEDAHSKLWFQLAWMKNYWVGIPFHSYLQNIYGMISLILT